MNGHVDDSLRALLEVRAGAAPSDRPASVTVWIDTAFDGCFVFPTETIAELGLQQEATTEVILADGSCVTLESYVCFLDWFGQIIPAQVIANQGQLPLLGTELLANRRLIIDYEQRTVSIH